ncbi:DUF397 domain-containing protein [Streptomyces sp. NPDC018031]|uniref:DUF397 domain-containing protein n=1 Tax=Streptomyces sp. NPDC018031 TaxID=3365033 RepID=UPI0037880359
MSTLEWRKSSYCQTGNNCLTMAAHPAAPTVRLRESEDPGVEIALTRRALAGFIRAARGGRFDGVGQNREA